MRLFYETYNPEVVVITQGKRGGIIYDGKEIPLILYAGVTKLSDGVVRYNEMFNELQKTIMENKFD